jgi:hypothetical protein
MAINSSLRRIVRIISRTVRFHVAVEGLIPGLCVLAGTYHEPTCRMRLTFGTVTPIDKAAMHAGIIREIRRALSDFSQTTLIISLVVEILDDLSEIDQKYVVGEGEIDLTKLLARV